jgi:hypothetical protein
MPRIGFCPRKAGYFARMDRPADRGSTAAFCAWIIRKARRHSRWCRRIDSARQCRASATSRLRKPARSPGATLPAHPFYDVPSRAGPPRRRWTPRVDRQRSTRPGWEWSGGENDGKLHGPLRLGEIRFERPPKGGLVDLELEEIQITASCPASRRCLAYAALVDGPDGPEFQFTARALRIRRCRPWCVGNC